MLLRDISAGIVAQEKGNESQILQIEVETDGSENDLRDFRYFWCKLSTLLSQDPVIKSLFGYRNSTFTKVVPHKSWSIECNLFWRGMTSGYIVSSIQLWRDGMHILMFSRCWMLPRSCTIWPSTSQRLKLVLPRIWSDK